MSTVKVDQILALDGSETTPPSIPALNNRMASAWANLNGIGVVALRSSFNVSSAVDNGTGNYTFNYAIPIGADSSITIATSNPQSLINDVEATSVRVQTSNSSGGAADAGTVCITAFSN